MLCRFCEIPCIKAGFQKSGKRKWYCKECNKYQSDEYRYKAYQKDTDLNITKLLKEGVGIRSTSRILNISPTTVIKRIRAIASRINRPAEVNNVTTNGGGWNIFDYFPGGQFFWETDAGQDILNSWIGQIFFNFENQKAGEVLYNSDGPNVYDVGSPRTSNLESVGYIDDPLGILNYPGSAPVKLFEAGQYYGKFIESWGALTDYLNFSDPKTYPDTTKYLDGIPAVLIEFSQDSAVYKEYPYNNDRYKSNGKWLK